MRGGGGEGGEGGGGPMRCAVSRILLILADFQRCQLLVTHAHTQLKENGRRLVGEGGSSPVFELLSRTRMEYINRDCFC